jgi:hypothetical protein
MRRRRKDSWADYFRQAVIPKMSCAEPRNKGNPASSLGTNYIIG